MYRKMGPLSDRCPVTFALTLLSLAYPTSNSSLSKTIHSQKSIPCTSPNQMTSPWQICITTLLMMHLVFIVLTYATNWRRSSIEDKVLVSMQPYLIGLNWYQEMLPIEGISENYKPGSVRITIENANAPNSWTSILDLTSSHSAQAKIERLIHVSSELASAEDLQGLTRLLKSVVLHLEKGRSPNSPFVTRIRLEKVANANATDNATTNATGEVLYEASLARFPSGEFGFIPKVESHRSVRANEAIGVKP